MKLHHHFPDAYYAVLGYLRIQIVQQVGPVLRANSNLLNEFPKFTTLSHHGVIPSSNTQGEDKSISWK